MLIEVMQMDKMNKKNERVYIRVNLSDKERIFKNAKASGMSASEYLRKLINDKEIVHKEDYMQIKELIYEVNKIGKNINQIAKLFNSGFFSETEKRKLFALMQKLNDEVANISKGF